jgi:ferredoxin
MDTVCDRARDLFEFHLGTPTGHTTVTPATAGLVPAALDGLASSAAEACHDPFVCGPDPAGPASFAGLVRTALAGAETPWLAVLCRAADAELEARNGALSLNELLDAALDRLRAAGDVGAAGEVGAGIDALRGRMPRQATAIRLGPHALIELVHAVVRDARAPVLDPFVREVRELATRVEELIRLSGPDGRTGGKLAPTLGEAGIAAVDAEALARSLGTRRGRRLDTARRERLAGIVTRLRAFVDGSTAGPPVEVTSLEEAVARFESAAADAIPMLAAARAARLELTCDYDPARHDAALAALDWRGLTSDELLLLPAIVVLENARAVRDGALSALSRILLSGRPIRVVVAESIADSVPDGHLANLGYIALAHREAFVLQSSLGRAAHLVSGLRRLATTPGPAAAFVAVPRWGSPVAPWLQLLAAWNGRGTPCFAYAPANGPSFAESFDLDDNPALDRPWPSHRLPDGIDERFTWAHVAALDPTWHAHFRILSPDEWRDDQVEVATYLDTPDEGRRRLVPFVWVAGDGGRPCRAAITRTLAFACRDRARAWRTLSELAGRDNEHVKRAVTRAVDEMTAAAALERERLESAHAAALERVRTETAEAATRRLAAKLLDLDGAEPATLAPTAPAAAPPAAAAGAPAPSEAPWIESALCTSCNECTNLNGKMFRYDKNKQAYLANAAAGTFDQLVRAAEKCPARCIHPGRPRPDDKTATSALVARAAAFA